MVETTKFEAFGVVTASSGPDIIKAYILTSPSRQYVAINTYEDIKDETFYPQYKWYQPRLTGLDGENIIDIYPISAIHELEKRLIPNSVRYININVPQFEDADWRALHGIRTMGN